MNWIKQKQQQDKSNEQQQTDYEDSWKAFKNGYTF